jgi:hypothetical protein
MDFLLGDVRKNRFPGRLADRKSSVAALPAESVMALAFYDSGRAGFEILDQLGEGDLSGESAKEYGHDLAHRRPEAGRTPSPVRANRHAPPIGVRGTARMAFDFWWRK